MEGPTESSTLYLLQKDENLVVASLPITGNKPDGFAKVITPPAALLYTWVTGTEDNKTAYKFEANGTGTFYVFGASMPFTYTVTDGRIYIDGSYGVSYTIDDNSLTVNPGSGDSLVYTKTSTPPLVWTSGDIALHGAWRIEEEGYIRTLEFRSYGQMVMTETYKGQSYSGTQIWKASDGKLYMISPGINRDNSSPSGMDYSLYGNTLEVQGYRFTKQ